MVQTSKKVFIDTSFFIAFIDRANYNHIRCVPIFEFLGRHNYQVYTSLQIVLQTFTRLEKDVGTVIGQEFLQVILESNIQILYPGKAELGVLMRYLKLNPNLQANLTEVLNSVLMERLDIGYVLTYDAWHNSLGTQKSDLIT